MNLSCDLIKSERLTQNFLKSAEGLLKVKGVIIGVKVLTSFPKVLSVIL